MAKATFFWHDYETFGLDPQRDFPAQFAGVRTDADFNLVGKPLVLYCKPSADCLPQPEACLITGLTPQYAAENGVCEAEFISLINQQLVQENTCSLGYNTLRFDDEVTRNALYRNFYDPYQREWQNGNSRWDLIDVVRATRALRPDGIVWVDDEIEKRPSFKLTDLTHANGIAHEAAHDALSDVYATMAMARLVKQRQPKLFHFLWENRLKNKALALLQLGEFKPVVHVSGKYPARKNCLALVLPICKHPTNPNGVMVYDLSIDPQPLLELSAAEIQQRVFTAVADLPEGVERVPLKTVHLNKCPVLAPFSVLTVENTAERLDLDVAMCLKNLAKIKATATKIAEKIAIVFGTNDFEPHTDPDLMIYSGGFFGPQDKATLAKIRTTPPSKLAALQPHFVDKRLAEMFFRYKGRNYPQTLNAAEQQRWREFCLTRLTAQKDAYFAKISELKQQPTADLTLLEALETYGQEKLTLLTR
jgi:exodeoxyribonuclease-1